MWSKLPSLNSKYLVISLISLVVVIVVSILAVYFIPKFLYVGQDGLKIGNVVDRVKGQAITEEQLAKFDKIYNAQARYQQKFDKKIKVAGREEVLTALKEAVLIEQETKKRGISVSTQESAEQIKSFDFALYDLNKDQAKDLVEMQILRQKLTNVLVGWREFGFVAIRFDLMAQNIDLSVLKPKAQTTLEKKKNAFNQEKSAASIAKEIREDPSFITDFSTKKLAVSPVQSKEPPKSKKEKSEGKTVAKGTQSLDKYVLNLTAPTIKVWCTDAACYLIKVTAGNEGKYKSLQEWLDKELGN